jgi:hypothetical protein
MIGEDVELEARLKRYGEVLNREVRVSPLLHARILSGAPAPVMRRSRGVWLQLAAAAALVVIGVGIWAVISKVRAEQLAASAPRVEATVPRDHATDVPLRGLFRVTFAARPSEQPVLTYKPADGTPEPAQWDGNTLVIKYAGLHPSKRYQMILVAPFRTSFGDRHNLERSWSFTTEGPAQISSTVPANGQNDAARIGQIQVTFLRRAPADPAIRIEPADAKFDPGTWKDSTFTVSYGGLKPDSSYRAILDLDLGGPPANLHQEWSFVTEPGAPPKGVQLIWVGTTSRVPPSPDTAQRRLLAYDWTGKLRGTLYTDQPGWPSPDGSLFLIPDVGITDTNGNLIQKFAGVNKGGPVWADDNRHICEMHDANGAIPQGNGEAGWLWVRAVGDSPRRVAQFGTFGGQGAPAVLACSFSTGRALLQQSGPMSINSVQVIDLNTGRVLFRQQYPIGEVGSILASHDGRFLAEEAFHIDGPAQVSDGTRIRRLSDGVVVARFDQESAVGFSWDAPTIMLQPGFGKPGTQFRLVNWQTGKVLWTQPVPSPLAPQTYPFILAMPEPGGTRLLVGIGTFMSTGKIDAVWIIRADGSAEQFGTGLGGLNQVGGWNMVYGGR